MKLIVQKSPVFPGTWHKWAFNDQANLIRENLKRSLSVRTSWYSMEEKHCLLFIPKTIKLIQSFQSIKDLSLKNGLFLPKIESVFLPGQPGNIFNRKIYGQTYLIIFIAFKSSVWEGSHFRSTSFKKAYLAPSKLSLFCFLENIKTV